METSSLNETRPTSPSLSFITDFNPVNATFIRTKNGIGKLTSAQVWQDNLDATFNMVPAQTLRTSIGPDLTGWIALQPIEKAKSSMYLRHKGDQIVLDNVPVDDGNFGDAIFKIEPGLNGKGISLRSFNKAGYRIGANVAGLCISDKIGDIPTFYLTRPIGHL